MVGYEVEPDKAVLSSIDLSADIGALKIEDSKVVVRSNRCYGCGLCRQMCITWSVLWGQKK